VWRRRLCILFKATCPSSLFFPFTSIFFLYEQSSFTRPTHPSLFAHNCDLHMAQLYRRKGYLDKFF
jgi:hypothetical protein